MKFVSYGTCKLVMLGGDYRDNNLLPFATFYANLLQLLKYLEFLIGAEGINAFM